jgi:cytochrome c oxidase accessory protein FixG
MSKKDYNEGISFRNKISTVDTEGKRIWVVAKQPKGRFYNWRQLVGYGLLAFLFVVPFIKVNGEPLLMFNIIERKFIIFGVIFWTQDSYLFALTMLLFMVFIVLFTVVYGRIWCGWTCPQTVFMELVFRRIEWLIEGTPAKQKQRASEGWTFARIFLRATKLIVFWLVSFVIANFLLAFIIGIDEVFQIASEPISQHLKGFIILMIFTTFFFWLFAWFREQACVVMCPYGRIQGVLLDAKTISVAYDYLRGEPRKGITGEGEKEGDCTNCKQCIAVCPTNIDIRNGTQLECVNCTACIDACDNTMDKINKPRGLIRFASEENISKGEKFKFNARIKGYTLVLILLFAFFITLLLTRGSLEATILRTPNTLFQMQTDGTISNLYNIKVVNKTRADIPVVIKLKSHKGEIQMAAGELVVKAKETTESVFFVKLNPKNIQGAYIEIVFGIYDAKGNELQEVESTFVAK